MENSSPYEQIFQKSQKTQASPAAFGPAKPVIPRTEPEVKTEEACHRAKCGLFLTAACKMLVLKTMANTLLFLSLSPSVPGGRHLTICRSQELQA